MKRNATIILLIVLVLLCKAKITTTANKNSQVKMTERFLPYVKIESHSIDDSDTADVTKAQMISASRKRAEMLLAKVVQGKPLVIPLPEESDPTQFLVPVSNDSINLRIDRLYLVDTNVDDFCFEKDTYQVEKIKYFVNMNTDAFHEPYFAVVTNIKNGMQKEYEISGYQYLQIRKMNDNRWDGYPSNITIPIEMIK